ncbi:hypothetical protein Bca4012_063799 [Brassica carinata]
MFFRFVSLNEISPLTTIPSPSLQLVMIASLILNERAEAGTKLQSLTGKVDRQQQLWLMR